jgi:hypothetical protein
VPPCIRNLGKKVGGRSFAEKKKKLESQSHMKKKYLMQNESQSKRQAKKKTFFSACTKELNK